MVGPKEWAGLWFGDASISQEPAANLSQCGAGFEDRRLIFAPP